MSCLGSTIDGEKGFVVPLVTRSVMLATLTMRMCALGKTTNGFLEQMVGS